MKVEHSEIFNIQETWKEFSKEFGMSEEYSSFCYERVISKLKHPYTFTMKIGDFVFFPRDSYGRNSFPKDKVVDVLLDYIEKDFSNYCAVVEKYCSKSDFSFDSVYKNPSNAWARCIEIQRKYQEDNLYPEINLSSDIQGFLKINFKFDEARIIFKQFDDGE